MLIGGIIVSRPSCSLELITLKMFLGVNTIIDYYKTYFKVLYSVLFSVSQYMFRSAEITIRRSLNIYPSLLNCQLKWVHFLHLILVNKIGERPRHSSGD
jgi:hypothetical protein